MLEIFCESLTEGIFPDAMKLAIVKPLYKKGDKSDICNYRPISLLPVMSKVLEKMMYNRVTDFITKHDVLYEGQYGFRSNRNTTDAVCDGMISILNSLNNNQYALVTLLDMSKAFDCLNHNILLEKLEKYGLRGTCKNWFKSYLKDRKLQVNFVNTLSKPQKVIVGTAQGSNLGPLLYLLYTNDLFECITFSENINFADDTTLITMGKNIKSLYARAQSDLSNMYNYFVRNDLCMNLTKTCYIVIGRKLPPRLPTLNIGGIYLKRVKSEKFLGINLDEKLNWEEHVNYVTKKLHSSIYAIRLSKRYLDIDHKLMLYHAIFSSHVQYGLLIWGSMLSKRNLKRLQILQNRSIRMVFNIDNRTSVKPYLKNHNILNIEQMIDCELGKLLYRVSNNTICKRIVNKFNSLCRTEHRYETRHCKDLNIPKQNDQLYSNSFLVKSPKLWQKLPTELKTHKYPSFKSSLKKYVLQH